ncbi:MAG TPA: VWA domain-containing protein [Pyrinomonadaceae bacterium]|jgi:VWFA-related protein
MFLPSSVARGWRLLLAPLLALLVLTAAPAAPNPRTQEPAPTPTPQTQQPTPTQTPSPTPTPAETPTPEQTPAPTPEPSPDEGEAVERIDTDLTSVLLSAADKKRRFVNTLRAEDVRVVEDGVEQRISSFERETDAPLSLVLLVDTSASQEKVLKEEQEAASVFIRSVLRPARDTAAVLSFTGVTRLEQLPTADASLLLAAVASLQVRYTNKTPECQNLEAPADIRLRCLTGVWDAVVLSVREVLSKTPERTRRAVILLSDGDDTSSRVRLYQAAEYAVRHNAVVYSVGIRDKDFDYGEMRRDFLQSLSDQTGGRAFFPKRPADLAAAFAQIEQELRSQYLITYTSTNRARDGSFRKLQIEIANPELKKQNLRLLYRQGYFARQ